MSRPPQAALGLLLALPLLLLTGWIALHRGDAPAPDDGDLRIAEPTAAPGENGFERFAEAADAARLPKDEATWRRFHAFRSGDIWEPGWIAELAAENAPATALFRAGVASPAFAFPKLDPRVGDARMHTLFLGQQLVALSGAQSRIALRDGRDGEALELASLGLRAGRRLSAADNVDLFGIYMATAFQTLSLIDLEHAARSSRIAPDTARGLGALLESSRWRASDWRRVWALEYTRVRAELEVLDPSTAGWPSPLLPGAYRWQPNRTATAIADLYREQSDKSSHFCADANLARAGGHPLASLATATSFAPNGLGRFVIEQVRERNYDRIQSNRCQFETQVSLVEVMIAAKAYSDSEGRLPERLEELVPRYLDALPLDRYDGASLRYARATPAVYSIGEDQSDAGGGAARGLFDPDEPGLSLAF